jgi:hypothetical protein
MNSVKTQFSPYAVLFFLACSSSIQLGQGASCKDGGKYIFDEKESFALASRTCKQMQLLCFEQKLVCRLLLEHNNSTRASSLVSFMDQQCNCLKESGPTWTFGQISVNKANISVQCRKIQLQKTDLKCGPKGLSDTLCKAITSSALLGVDFSYKIDQKETVEYKYELLGPSLSPVRRNTVTMKMGGKTNPAFLNGATCKNGEGVLVSSYCKAGTTNIWIIFSNVGQVEKNTADLLKLLESFELTEQQAKQALDEVKKCN